jgi:electron transport complex protein RnfD
MLDVLIGLAPAMVMAVVYFRMRAVLLVAACVVACAATEWVCNAIRRKAQSIDDLSAVVTGVILAFSLPPAAPVWLAALGGVFAIAIGKMVYGGLGGNTFNPAMVGRAFLTVSFGMLMTTWTVPATIDPSMPTIAPTNTEALTQATPLAWSKEAIKGKADAEVVRKQLPAAITGQIGGCLGETSALALLIGGVYLLVRKTITYHIPAAVLLAAAILAAVGYLIKPGAYVPPIFHVASGALLFGAFFIATDPVTAPLTTKGMWIFGAGVGALVMLIRIAGELPEGVMYAVLLMNGLTPLIDRFCKLVPVGGKTNA